MQKSLMALRALAMAIVLPLVAQPAGASHSKRMLGAVPPHGNIHPGVHFNPSQLLQTWNGTITSSSGTTYNFTMVGTDPSTTNTTTTIQPYVIPIAMDFRCAGVQKVFDPLVDRWNGIPVVTAIDNSPLFQSVDWQWGGTDMGTTQYVDAFQRGSFWQNVSVNTNYHVLFAQPIVLQEQTICPTTTQGGMVVNDSNGHPIGHMYESEFLSAVEGLLPQFSVISPAVLPIFVTDNFIVDLPTGYGLHGADTNYQTYLWGTFFTYIGDALPVLPDVKTLSHELGEWMDDPYVMDNSSPCGRLEVGDPLQHETTYITVSSSNLTWHFQALSFMEYFGKPSNFSANNSLDNLNLFTQVCQNGP